MAGLGCSGKYPGNIERDIHRWGRRAGNGGLGIRVQPYFLKLDMLNGNGDPVPRWFGILLPHELFADMMCTPGDRGYDHLLGKAGTLQEFWDLQKDQDWFQAHPLRDTLGGQHDVPIRLWGDDRPLGKNRELRTLTWTSAVCHGSAWETRFPIYFVETDYLHPTTEREVLRVVAWSLDALARGKHPAKDYNGRAFPEKSLRGKRAGTALTPWSFRGIFCQVGGDWKWLIEVFNWPWTPTALQPCRKCRCTSAGPLVYTDCRPQSTWLHTLRSHQECMLLMAAGNLGLSPLCHTLGWHCGFFKDDLLHDDFLGVRLHLNASCLVLMCEWGAFGARLPGPWKDSLNLLLHEAFRQCRTWLRNHGLQCRISKCSCNVLTLHDQLSWPVMKCKGYASAVISLWLHSVAQAHAPATMEGRVVTSCLSGWAALFALYHGPMALTDQCARKWEIARQRALCSYNWLSNNSLAAGRFKFCMIPKFHKLDESLRESIRSRLNAASHWTFKDESWLQYTGKLCWSTHVKTLQFRGIQRWLLVFLGSDPEALPF